MLRSLRPHASLVHHTNAPRSAYHIQKHVPQLVADLVMISQEPLANIASPFRRSNRHNVPQFDEQFDPLNSRDGPTELGQRSERINGVSATTLSWRNRIASARPTFVEVLQPQTTMTDRSIIGTPRNREREASSLRMTPLLAYDPGVGLRRSGVPRQ